ncbi:MAG TPA: glucose-6-phosphate isomerase [Actinomycetaceae bacterium]|nr:glucose-6-phosphate isomerase [Actinomycetaceae bacterium]
MTRSGAVMAWAGGDNSPAAVEVSATGAAAAAVHDAVGRLVSDRVASRLSEHDASLWGEAAAEEAAIRLGWTKLHDSSRDLLDPLAKLRAELQAEGIERVVLCGMGGSSLAPEVMAGTAGVQLVVLDSTHPAQVARALDGDLAATVVVVASKSGTTVETDSQRRAFTAAFADAGIDPATRLIAVTDPGSALATIAREEGYRAVFEADPTVGGRFSALSAFGLVPAALAGVDVAALLDDAAQVADILGEDHEANPALVLAAALAATAPLRDKIVITDAGSGLYHFGDWAEQLLAESTGKEGKGLLPIIVDSAAPELRSGAANVLPVLLCPQERHDEAPPAAAGGEDDDDGVLVAATEVTVAGSLGAMFLLWEHAVAIAGRLLGINPFDQPNVESAKQAARGLLDDTPPPSPVAFEDSGVVVFASPAVPEGSTTLSQAVSALLDQIPEDGYLAVMAYLDREGRGAQLLKPVRSALARRTQLPVTFGWGPRFLHSTGQYHKGGPARGVFLQLTDRPTHRVSIPGRDFDFGSLIAAQAAGDARVLTELGRPVLRLQVTGPDALAWLAGMLAAPGTP